MANIPRDVLITLVTLSASALLSVWIAALQTPAYKGRYALVGCVGIAGLIAFALQRWKLPVRFLLPAAGVGGLVLRSSSMFSASTGPKLRSTLSRTTNALGNDPVVTMRLACREVIDQGAPFHLWPQAVNATAPANA